MPENNYVWSDLSRARLESCDAKIQKVINKALSLGLIDMTVTCGHRGQKEQDAAYNSGHSKLKFPNSKHNAEPSAAVDVKPYIKNRNINWKDYSFMAGIILTVARYENIEMRWGGNWDMDGDILEDQSFDDGAHFELI